MLDISLDNDLRSKHYKLISDNSESTVRNKVLFVIDTLQFGGAEQSLLVNSIGFKKIQPVICHLYEGEALKLNFVENGIRVHSLNIKNKYGFVSAFKKLAGIVKAEKPDLMVAYLTRSEIITRLVGKFNNIPVVGSFVSDLYGKAYNQHLSWKAKKMVYVFKMLNRFTSRYCVGFVANSHTIKHANSNRLSVADHKVKVINRGRASYKFKTKSFVQQHTDKFINFLNVGRLFPVKGQRELIIGFKKFLEAYSYATLSIIGDGPMREGLQQLIKDLKLEDRVFLLGARDDVPSIISDFDCFVFPSLSEGFSGAVVEAMFAGLPVLASDIPQNKEAITHMQNGFLFESGSVDEIANAMSWFKDNRPMATRFAKKAFEFAKQNFELENTIEQFENYLCTQIGFKYIDQYVS